MKYEELVERVRKATQNVKVSRAIDHLAFQFNIEGEAEGAFYIEIVTGKVNVEPYEYYDRDIIVVTTADILLQIVEGKLQAMAAYTNGELKVYGNVDLIKYIPVCYDGKNEV